MFVLRVFAQDGAPLAVAKSQFQHLPIRIGRNPLNDFVLEFTTVSSFHARIEDCNGKLCVRDLGSTNGIFLPSTSEGKLMRIGANTNVALDPANLCFFVSPHFKVRVEVVAQQAPMRSSLTCKSVLGNRAIISVVDSPPSPAPVNAAQSPPIQANIGFSPAGHHPSAPPADRESGRHLTPDRITTEAFRLELPMLALIGLRELAGSLIPQRSLETSGDIARFITKLHDAMDVFCRTFIPLRKGYSEFVASLDLHTATSGGSAYASPSTVALKQAKTPEAIALALLDPKDNSFDGPDAVEGILADLMLHQVALLDAVMEGVRSLLHELSPQSIEQATGGGGAAGLLGSKYKARWDEFCARFERLSEGQQAFSFVFGQEFAHVYREYWHRKSKGEDGVLRTERPQR
jgi:predicted component of type VI protein secretion system